MQSARCISALLLMLMAAYVAFANAWCLIASARNRRKGIDRHHSTVPLVSMILAALAYWLYPFRPKWWIFGVAALDLGNWALFLGLPLLFLQNSQAPKPPRTPDDSLDI